MGDMNNATRVKVPYGEGHFIGDLLRKYAVRFVRTWQPVGYFIERNTVNFGMSNGCKLDVNVLIPGYCVEVEPSNERPKIGEIRIVDFAWNGEYFEYENLALVGVPHAIGSSVKVCLRYASGNYDADTNREYLLEAAVAGGASFIGVPSNHSRAGSFTYTVEPIDTLTEYLVIDAKEGVAQRAYDHALDTLQSVSI